MAGRFPDPNFGGKQEQERFRVENYPERRDNGGDPCPWLWAQHPQLTITVGRQQALAPNTGPSAAAVVPTKREERHG